MRAEINNEVVLFSHFPAFLDQSNKRVLILAFIGQMNLFLCTTVNLYKDVCEIFDILEWYHEPKFEAPLLEDNPTYKLAVITDAIERKTYTLCAYNASSEDGTYSRFTTTNHGDISVIPVKDLSLVTAIFKKFLNEKGQNELEELSLYFELRDLL